MMDRDQRQQLAIARRRHGSIARAAKLSTNNERVNAAKRIMAEMHENERRRTDPFERAKSWLQRKGYTVYDRRRVHGGDNTGIQVGRQVLDDEAAVMALAVRLGFDS